MKLVIGIVRPEKANEVLEALYRAEVRGVSMSRVQGHGGELDRVETYRGTTVKMGLAEKVRFEIAVSDAVRRATIEALCEGARTGEVGDGKIFVVPLERPSGSAPARPTTPPSPRWGMMARSSPAGQHRRHRLDARRDRARADDDPGARALLRRARAREEHAQHVHDVRRRDRGRDGQLGADRLLVRVLRGQRDHRRARPLGLRDVGLHAA